MNLAVRIYDTFLFDGELDLLDHRLRQNFDATDVFVLIEASEAYRGQPKPLIFAENHARFVWAAGKIRHIQLHSLGPPGATPRQRAAVQRNSMLMALDDATDQDIVLLLDADEVPSLEALTYLRARGLAEPHRMEMTRHYQWLNQLAPASTCCIDQGQPFPFAVGHQKLHGWNSGPTWSGRSGVALPLSYLKGTETLSPFQWRFYSRIDKVLHDAGRHLTAVDPAAYLPQKMGRVFHAEWATDRGMYPAHLARCQHHAVHHRGWWYAEIASGELPHDLATLASTHPRLMRTDTLPKMWRRRCVRTWAWLRQYPIWSDRMVERIDDHFDHLLPWLAPVFLLLDGSRHIAAVARRKRPKTSIST